MLLSNTDSFIFPQFYILVPILLALSVGAATMEKTSFSQTKMIKRRRIRNGLLNKILYISRESLGGGGGGCKLKIDKL